MFYIGIPTHCTGSKMNTYMRNIHFSVFQTSSQSSDFKNFLMLIIRKGVKNILFKEFYNFRGVHKKKLILWGVCNNKLFGLCLARNVFYSLKKQRMLTHVELKWTALNIRKKCKQLSKEPRFLRSQIVRLTFEFCHHISISSMYSIFLK